MSIFSAAFVVISLTTGRWQFGAEVKNKIDLIFGVSSLTVIISLKSSNAKTPKLRSVILSAACLS